MNKEQLETNIAALELLVSETTDKSIDFKAQLEQAKQELKDINKPKLTPSQLDDIQEAIESAVEDYDFNDSNNYETDFSLDYEGRVQLESIDLQDTHQLVEMIVKKVHALFVEAECPEDELDTTEPDHHAPIESPDTTPVVDTKPSKNDMQNLKERAQNQKEETKEKTFKKRTWFSK